MSLQSPQVSGTSTIPWCDMNINLGETTDANQLAGILYSSYVNPFSLCFYAFNLKYQPVHWQSFSTCAVH